MTAKRGPGQPTKLTEGLKMRMLAYTEDYESYGDLIPSVAGFASEEGVSRGSLQKWRQDNVDAEYSDIFDALLAKQERALLSGGLSKKFSSQITALALGKHGYHNKTDHTSSDGSMTPQVTEIQRRIVKPDD
jgi:hypothetical protein